MWFDRGVTADLSQQSVDTLEDAESSPDWWRTAVVYQIYVRSFADGNGDGTGDIAGLRNRLPHLARLGVDAIWVNPWYESPLNDGGYDVADYRRIDPRYGTVDEAELLIREASDLDIRVLVDLVPNHTSSAHAWFQEALAAEPGSEARNRYHFTAGRGDNGELPPNDWPSVFGGPAWTRVPDGEWYLHLFDTTQPDLNWELPEVRSEFESILRFWLDRGAAGFRVDVAHSLTKAPGYPDLGELSGRDGPLWVEGHPFWDRDDVHDIVRDWRSVLDEYDDKMMVAEAWVRADRRHLYVRPDEYHQAFDFDFLRAPWDAVGFAENITAAIEQAELVGSTNTWVLANHDVVRPATRYALPQDVDATFWMLGGDRSLHDTEVGRRRARAAALVMLCLPGSAYLYQGDELALPEAYDLPLDVLDDPIWNNTGQTVKGRDGCRVPIPWTSSGSSMGFGDAEPWLPQPAEFANLSVESQQNDPGSTLNLFREAIRIRSERLVSEPRIETRVNDGVLTIRRGSSLACIVNMGSDTVDLPSGEVLLSTASNDDRRLAVNEAAWLQP